MEDRLSKFLGLFWGILFSFIGIIGLLVLLMFGLKLIMGGLDHFSWFSYFYTSFFILLPACFFGSVYWIYFRKTKAYPVVWVRYFSNIIFFSFVLLWIYNLYRDGVVFLKNAYTSIDKYDSYNLLFLSVNVAALFLIGIIQALSTEKEKDWMQKRAEREGQV